MRQAMFLRDLYLTRNDEGRGGGCSVKNGKDPKVPLNGGVQLGATLLIT